MTSYVYYDKTGILKEFITIRDARKGDNDNTIYFCFEQHKDMDVGSAVLPTVAISYKRPKDTDSQTLQGQWVSEEVPYDEMRPLRYFKYFKHFTFYKITPPALDQEGIWVFTPMLDNNACGVFTANVQDNSIQLDPLMTISNFYYLLDKINNLETTLAYPYPTYDKTTKKITLKAITDDDQSNT